ncbi:hypothetical protein [Phenylobacterium sp.]|uniref:hypothetical protein n=1 Tax=Phenylobacterium sp. TaxID=1871053 RepID=UPI0025D5238D|nr:hypothetical protein [Phenylobacterium sp.]
MRQQMRMKAWVIAAMAAVAFPAKAVPPVPPSAATLEVMAELLKTVAANDLPGFKRLFDSGAELSIGKWDGAATSGWKSVDAEFSNPGRQTRVLAAYETGVPKSADLVVQRYLVLSEISDCRPNRIECFPYVVTDVVDVRSDRKVIQFKRSLAYRNKVAAPQLKLEAYGH